MLAAIDEEDARITTSAERTILTTMQCGCHAPVGAYARITEGQIIIRVFISGVEGTNYISRDITGPTGEATQLAESIATQLLEAGGKQILESLKK
ncbi:MAG: hypothetical protein ACYTGS_13065 [Planctomycetota bacterium]